MIATQEPQLRVARAEADDTLWDEFVQAAPESSFGHLSAWRGIVEDVLGREYIGMVAVTPDGEWQGVLPLVRIRAPLFGHSIISMPYLNYGGPVGSAGARRILIEAAVRESQRSGADAFQIRSRHGFGSATPADARKVLVLLDLPQRPETLWDAFPSKLRSQIRRPLKEGMEFRTGRGELDAFYDVFCRNMRDLGTPVYPRAFFERIAQRFPEFVVGAVYYQGRPVGAGAGFLWRGEFEITWASTVRDYNRLAPNMLLYWGFMEEMIRRGASVFNFGRSTPGASTHRFKTQWGGHDVPLPWLDWSAGEGTKSSPSGLTRAVSTAWQHLPLRLANRLGPPIACRLPWW
jgi:serine/alanine adding enzyme